MGVKLIILNFLHVNNKLYIIPYGNTIKQRIKNKTTSNEKKKNELYQYYSV